MKKSYSRLKVEIPRNDEQSLRSYTIFTGLDILGDIGSIASDHDLPVNTVVITDSNVENLYAGRVMEGLADSGFEPRVIVIPAGEEQKNLDSMRLIFDKLNEFNFGRDTAIIALGGGVIGDLAGFAAAVYHRGIPFAQMPTTLLAQVDSSVGGKTGVNLPYGKNLIGAFYQPSFVLIDVQTLSTLPARELKSGMAEVVKYGAILDSDFFNMLESAIDDLLIPDLKLFPEIVRKCCSLKASVVEKDERESGYREILNFGHTIGHAIESATGYSVLTHGEAIAYGMIAEGMLSVGACGLDENDAERLRNLLLKLTPPPVPRSADTDILYKKMFSDKKVRSGRLRFSLIEKIGKAVFGITPDEDAIRKVLIPLVEKQ